jgi:hypothetical protein
MIDIRPMIDIRGTEKTRQGELNSECPKAVVSGALYRFGDVLQTGAAGLFESAVVAALCRRGPKKVCLWIRANPTGADGRGLV